MRSRARAPGLASAQQGPPKATLDVPTPAVLYINDDLTDAVRQRFGAGSEPDRLVAELLERAVYDPERVVVLTVEEQVEGIVSDGPRRPFEVAVAIGDAGHEAARRIHRRTGWFPRIKKIDLTRIEDGRGGYDLAGAESLGAALADVTGTVAIVDDTVFSGITATAVLDALPGSVLGQTEVFCLKAVAATVERLRERCPVTVGFSAPGTILDEVSIINATGLVYRVAIRPRHGPPMAFFERPEWMRAWFPTDHPYLIDICARLNAAVTQTKP